MPIFGTTGRTIVRTIGRGLFSRSAAPMLALLLLPALAPAAAKAQAMVSFTVGNNLAHGCYVSALTAVKTGARFALDGIGECDAALAGPLGEHDRAATLDNRGILHDVAGNNQAAWADFDASIKLNPALGDAWLNRGATLIRMKKAEQALPDIRHGVELGASLPEIGYYDLGVAEQSLGHIPEAYAAYKEALAANPAFTPAVEALKNFIVVPAGSSQEKSG